MIVTIILAVIIIASSTLNLIFNLKTIKRFEKENQKIFKIQEEINNLKTRTNEVIKLTTDVLKGMK